MSKKFYVFEPIFMMLTEFGHFPVSGAGTKDNGQNQKFDLKWLE